MKEISLSLARRTIIEYMRRVTQQIERASRYISLGRAAASSVVVVVVVAEWRCRFPFPSAAARDAVHNTI